ncbi:hypothetical protein PILCRDRAFT_3118 [Piloderma croceum F 1598]|uniref:Uncharacterized protein n=1 Tax=Piloderma croceum (strain F 1598) TaxID=765440 RepID=A0A0C3FXF6_PILCF|nr:hypothetical protein PILCRDRAFT_3118 [Piloderma croceum F 1598]
MCGQQWMQDYKTTANDEVTQASSPPPTIIIQLSINPSTASSSQKLAEASV